MWEVWEVDLSLLMMFSHYPVSSIMIMNRQLLYLLIRSVYYILSVLPWIVTVATADGQSLSSSLFTHEQSVTVPIADVQSLSCLIQNEQSVTISTADVHCPVSSTMNSQFLFLLLMSSHCPVCSTMNSQLLSLLLMISHYPACSYWVYRRRVRRRGW